MFRLTTFRSIPQAMPTYEFRCPDGHTFDHFFRTISAAQPEMPCPHCGKTAQRQISGGAGLSFKGSGFYLTDYGKNAHRGGSGAKPADGGTSSSGGGEGKASGGGEGKASGGEGKPAGGSSSSSSSSSSSTGGSGGGSSSGGGA